MTDDDSLPVPPYWHENGSGLYPSRAAKWVVDVWTEEKLFLRWIHSLEEDLFVLPTTRTLNRMSLHVGILMRNGQFWMSQMLDQLLFLFIETWVISKDLEVCRFLEKTPGELCENLQVSICHFYYTCPTNTPERMLSCPHRWMRWAVIGMVDFPALNEIAAGDFF